MKARLILCGLVGLLWAICGYAANIPGTVVAAKITTGNTANIFSIGDTDEMSGTPKQVSDITARDAIPAARRTEGMTCWVLSENAEYRLVGGVANANWTQAAFLTNTVTLYATNAYVEYFTNNYAITTNLYVTNSYVLYETNSYLYTTNLFATNTYVNYLTNNYLYTTNLYATNVYVEYLTNNFLFTTNLYTTNALILYETNSYLFTTNLYTTNEYVLYFTNNYAIITNLFNTNTYVLYFTNTYGWITNIINETMTNIILVSSNAYITNITAKNLYTTNIYVTGDAEFDHITVTNGITNLSLKANQFVGTDTNKRLTSTLNGDPLTNSAGYQVGYMADTNWVLAQIASLGSYMFFLGPTNSFAITNSTEAVSRTNIWTGSTAPFLNSATQTVSGLTLNAYVRHVISTNRFKSIESGPISIVSYPFRTGAGTVSGHWEIYWVDCVSNIMHEIASAPTQVIPTGTGPTFTQTSLTLTNGYVFTNQAYIAVAFKLDAIGTGGPTLSWAYGGQYDAHLTFVRPLSSATINVSQIAGMKGYLVLASPFDCDGVGAKIYTNDNTKTYFGQAQFNNAADKTANYCDYYITVPEDVNTNIDWRVERLKFQLGGADTGSQRYTIQLSSVADSAAYAGSFGNEINLDFAGDASGASGDVETVSGVTLTGWRSAITAGQLLVIRLARDGNDGGDTSTVDSYSGPLVISYGIQQ